MVQETLQINIKADTKSGVAGLKETITSLNKVEMSAKKTGAALGAADSSVKKSSQGYQNLGRIIQDLPFGFQGIQNNLTQLIPSIGALGLAFSGVVAAITFAQVGLTFWNRGSKEAKKNTDDLKKSQQEYAQSLAQEKVQLDVLFASATNANLPLQARKKAIQELRDNYGNYLKDFSDEEILAGKAAKAYDALSVAILKAAKARAAQSMLQKNVERQLLLEIELADVAKKAQQDAAKVNEAIKAGGNQIGGFQKFTSVQEQQADIFARAAGTAKQLANEYENLAESNKQLLATVQDNQIIPMTLDKATTAASNYNDELKKIISNTVLFQGDKRLQFAVRPEGGRDGVTPKARGEFIPPGAVKGVVEADNAAKQFKQTLEDTYAIANQLGNAFVQAFESGANFGEILANVIKDLVKQLVSALVKALIFKVILGAVTGGVGPAFGDIFKSFLGAGPRPFADGGIVNKPTLGVFGEAGSEAIMPLSKLDGMLQTASQLGGSQMGSMSLQTKVLGPDLLLWIQNAGFSTNLKR